MDGQTLSDLKSAFVVNHILMRPPNRPRSALIFTRSENSALIDGRFNRQRQAEPAQVTGRAQRMRVGFRRYRGFLVWRNPHLYRRGLFARFSFFGVH